VRHSEAAIQQQNVDAMFHLGLCLQYGTGFDSDLDDAASFYVLFPSDPVLENHSYRGLRA
jgi:hypothetical protein